MSHVVGRHGELAAASTFLDAAGDGPAALLLHGAVGAGKSTLWRATVETAQQRGYRVLACRPAESEAELAYAALGDLLDAVLDDPDVMLPPPQRHALAIATLVADSADETVEHRAVAVATLSVLRSLSTHTPTIVAIDDVQWVDPPSARVLEFALRRLKDERVGVVAVLRADDRSPMDIAPGAATRDANVQRVPVGAMTVDELDELLRRRLSLGLPRPVLGHVAVASEGNPLFALEMAKAIGRGELEPRQGDRLPVPETLQQLVRDRLDALPAAVRDALAVVAAAADPTTELLERAGVQSPEAADPIGVATAAGIAYVVGGRIEFTHPLYGSTLYYSLPADRRREIHGVLSELVEAPLEQARHLALAAAGPNSTVASALDDAAAIAVRRGASDAAAALLEHAAQLTPASESKAIQQRRARAADLHFTAGDTGAARGILESLVQDAQPGPVRAGMLRQLAKVRYSTDSSAVAAELLTRALSEAGDDRLLCAAIERDLAWAVAVCGDAPRAAAHANAAVELARTLERPELLAEPLAAAAMAEFALGRGVPDAIHRAVELAVDDLSVPVEWRPATVLAVMLKSAGNLDEALRLLSDLRRQAQERGDDLSLPFLLAEMSETETARGHWAAALGLADEAHAIAQQTGQERVRAGVLHARALAAAHLGRVEAARADAREGLLLAETVGSVIGMMQNQSVLGFVELSMDQPAAALRYLAPLVAWRDVVGIEEPGMLRFVPDAVEAFVARGRLAKANALLEPYEARAAQLDRAAPKLAAARCRAILTSATGDLVSGLTQLDDALAASEVSRQSFEYGRALLALGGIERRTHRRKSARTRIESAARTFEALGAALWADKARRLLGGPSDDTAKDWATRLTPAETRVAEIVGAGSTNREAADRLFVTVRTVELHLTSIYRKLGITSRSQLAHRVGRQAAPDRDNDEHQ